MARRRPSPFVLASALVQATTKAVVRTSLSLTEEAASAAGRSLAGPAGGGARGVGSLGRRVARGEVGIGPVRVRPDDLDWVRRQLAAGLRSLLALPEETTERLRVADPTTMARTVLALVGGDEALLELPTPREQVRQRLEALLAPDTTDEGTSASSLLTITAQLSPDEARVLRHVATTDRAVVLDVRSTSLTSRRGPIVAEHLSVLVERAGGDHPERGPATITNLLRLGLVTLDDRVDDDHADVALVRETAAYRRAEGLVRADGGRPRDRVRTLRLTALGEDLAAIALEALPPGTPDVDPPPVPQPRPLSAGGPGSLAGRARVTRPEG